LKAVRELQTRVPLRLVPTLLVHVPPADAKEREQYRAMVCSELIPRAAESGLASAVDIFVEEHAWRAADAEVVLRCAQAHGLGIKLHAEQFHRVGGLELGIALGALSVDHLEACGAEQCALFGGARTVATVLPGVSLHLGLPSAPGRALIDAGAAVAIGTDLNPGSSPLFSISAALALAVRLNGLMPSEALVACTANAAAALGMDGGALIVGQRADFVVVDSKDWRDLAYTLGSSAVHQVWAGGRRVAG
jgi:imidazolonepropionase